MPAIQLLIGKMVMQKQMTRLKFQFLESTECTMKPITVSL